MNWFLQSPGKSETQLLAHITGNGGKAERAGAAFAFASSQGIKLLASEPTFIELLETAQFKMIVGLDAITDIKAVDELRKLTENYKNFSANLFLHSSAGSIFHPKTLWIKRDDCGAVITGSGNLTAGGLKTNWEATSVQLLDANEIKNVESQWDTWIIEHSDFLKEIDDENAIERAKANRIVRSQIKKALKKPSDQVSEEEDISETIEAALTEAAAELSLNPVLIAEVPKSGNRWQQVNFDLKSYQEYFGVTKGTSKQVKFIRVRDDGTTDEPEIRQAVSVKSQNYRFEISAAQGLEYPSDGHPILVFEKIADDVYHYVLLMPPNKPHEIIQNFLNDNYDRKNKTAKLRIQITVGQLEKVWPQAPFFF